MPANVSVGVAPVMAQGPEPAKPVEIQVWSNSPVVAGSQLEITVVATTEAGSAVTVTVELADEFGNLNQGVEIVGPERVTQTTGLDGTAIFSYVAPTGTQQVHLGFSAAGLTGQHVLSVTPGAASNITATIRDDGSVAAMVFDQHGNARPGDSVTVTLETATGQSVTVQTKTVVPAEEAMAAPIAPPTAGREYTVNAGDSLWSIWESLGRLGPWQEWKSIVMKANNLIYTGDIVVIQIGQVLALPVG